MFIFATMLDRVKRIFIWLSRINHCSGFGIQSPSAYRFVRNAVYGDLQGDDALKVESPCLSYNEKKLCCLYARMSKFLQPDNVLNFDNEENPYRKIFLSSCNKVNFIQLNANENINYSVFLRGQSNSKFLIRVAPVGQYKKFIEAAIAMAGKGTVLVVEGIHQNSEMKQFWKNLQNDEHTGVSFDLYYCGIIFFDDRIKQHYIVNF
jgi:hypothetical protein